MTEFAAALFKFVPENDDELPLEIGERVEVLEKDQFHNDGWWTGRSASGRVGIFPASYAKSVDDAVSPSSPLDSAALQLQFDTLYDSIEAHFTKTQSLARRATYASYVSSDTEEEDGDRRASKGLRLKLALNARKARAEARHREKEFAIKVPLSPIEFDVSGSEADELESAQRQRLFESDDEADGDPFERIFFRRPTRGKSLRRAATRRRPSVPDVPALPSIPPEPTLVSFAESTRTYSPGPISGLPASNVSSSAATTVPARANAPTDAITTTSADCEDDTSSAAMDRRALSVASPSAARPVPNKTNSLALSEYSILRAPSSKSRPDRPQGEPQNWAVSEVVVYLKSCGFSDNVCSCFEEQDISGDVLAELDLHNLESEVGISAMGTRKRIVAAIAELALPSRLMIPELATSKSDEPAPTMLDAPGMRSLSPSFAAASLPTPDASPRKGSNELPASSPSAGDQRTAPPPSDTPPTFTVSSLPTPPEMYQDHQAIPAAPRSTELLPATLSAHRRSPTGAALVGSRPRPVSTSSALSASSPSPFPHNMHIQRPSVSPPSASIGLPPPPPSTNGFLPPGAARPRIPGAPVSYEGLPPSLVPGGVANRARANAQHGRHVSDVGPTITALPAPVFRQPGGAAAVGVAPAPKVAYSHQQSVSVTHITSALISGPFEVARATASAASSNKHLPDLLIPGRVRVGTPRGPRWHIRS